MEYHEFEIPEIREQKNHPALAMVCALESTLMACNVALAAANPAAALEYQDTVRGFGDLDAHATRYMLNAISNLLGCIEVYKAIRREPLDSQESLFQPWWRNTRAYGGGGDWNPDSRRPGSSQNNDKIEEDEEMEI